MPIQNCPIDIPEGWEFVRHGNAEVGETIMDDRGRPHRAAAGTVFPRVIIRRARPKLEVGDWVRVANENHASHGRYGRVISCHECSRALVGFRGNGDGGFFDCADLVKLSRTIEPYTIDRCITEIAIRGSRDVIRGGEPTEIVTVYSNGVSTDKPYVGFISYKAAAKAITWPNGDAFGVVTWEDAE